MARIASSCQWPRWTASLSRSASRARTPRTSCTTSSRRGSPSAASRCRARTWPRASLARAKRAKKAKTRMRTLMRRARATTVRKIRRIRLATTTARRPSPIAAASPSTPMGQRRGGGLGLESAWPRPRTSSARSGPRSTCTAKSSIEPPRAAILKPPDYSLPGAASRRSATAAGWARCTSLQRRATSRESGTFARCSGRRASRALTERAGRRLSWLPPTARRRRLSCSSTSVRQTAKPARTRAARPFTGPVPRGVCQCVRRSCSAVRAQRCEPGTAKA
mmetsp:Transcript_16173/g.41008  ORF Transcript_16173/g.41008 Transcript_16173/m.41008 type:complete len:278 (+) Transcript_16173:295-1128(+)